MTVKKDWGFPDKSKSDVAFHANTIFIYGIVKIGKTTLWSKMSDALGFLTEEGAKHLSIKAWHIKNWADFLVRLDTLEKAVKAGECPFKTVVIDTVDNLSDFCEQSVCDDLSINTLSDLEWGKGYKAYKREFTRQVRRLTQLGLGLVFISHSTEKDVAIASGLNEKGDLVPNRKIETTRMIIPTLDKRAFEFVSGLVDMIFFIGINNKGERVINTKPSNHFEAGDRSGRLSSVIPLDYDKLVEDYYSDDPTELINKINLAEQYLAEKMIDGFEVPTRAINSRKKHIKTEVLKDAKAGDLEGYLQHLVIKAKTKKKEVVK